MGLSVHPAERQPKGDHNRRLTLGMDPDSFAAAAQITVRQLRDYEETPPDGEFDLDVARQVGDALERLEADPPSTQQVTNG